jgi:ATP-dependent DNA helicase RecG
VDAQKLLTLLSKEEGPKLDFKVKLSIDTESSKKELAKDICAIANSRGGRGYLIFGVEDKTKQIVGINRDEFEEEKVQQIVSTRIDPPIPISVDFVCIDGKDLGVITIFNTPQKPHQFRETGAFYIRRGSTTDIMRKEEIASMLQDTGLINYELLPVVKATINDLDNEKLKNFFTVSGLPLQFDNSILQSIGIIVKEKDYNEYHPTYGAMMLFGKQPYNFLPHSIIRIHNFIDTSLPFHYIAKGTLIDMLDDACGFLKKCLKAYTIPFEVIEDLIGKAVVYRDYFDLNNCIEVYISKKRIEISNPGAIIKREANYVDKYVRRNMWLYLKLLAIDKDKKYFNKNINLNMLMKGHGKIKYINIPSKNMFKAIIPIENKIRQ